MPLPADRFFARGDGVERFVVVVRALLTVFLLVVFLADEALDAGDFATELFFAVFADDALDVGFDAAVFAVEVFADFDVAGLAFAFAPPDDVVFDFFDADFPVADFFGVGIFVFLQIRTDL